MKAAIAIWEPPPMGERDLTSASVADGFNSIMYFSTASSAGIKQRKRDRETPNSMRRITVNT